VRFLTRQNPCKNPPNLWRGFPLKEMFSFYASQKWPATKPQNSTKEKWNKRTSVTRSRRFPDNGRPPQPKKA
jgi:hypothetical protein